MMSLAARKLAGALPSRGYGALKATTKARVVSSKSPRSAVTKFASLRSYTTDTQSDWAPEDLALLGTYAGTPTARGQKKTSTGLVGLAVQPEARAVLIELHKKLAAELTKMPETFHYRTDAEESIQLRLATLLEETDVIRLEEELDDGQLESLIEEIHEDLNVNLPALFELKPWSAEVSKWDKAKLSLYSDVKLL